MTHYVVEAHVLEADLLDCLLEVPIVEYFKGVAIYE